MSRLAKLGLVVGYLSLTGAVAAAHFSPTSGYELSIYTSTPLTFWVLVAFPLVLAVVVAYSSEGILRSGALGLAVGSMYSIATLPLSRGYFFYGPGDSLTHLGWTKDIFAGRLYALDLFYPGLHTSTIFTSQLSALPIQRAMLLFVSFFVLVFVGFTFLTVRAVSTRRADVVTAVFIALMFLPFNHVTTHYMSPHPITDSILLIPFGLFLLARYVMHLERRQEFAGSNEQRRRVTQIGVMFGLYSIATVLYHSMQALHLLILLGGVLLVQVYFRARATWFGSTSFSRIVRHRPVYVQTAVLGGFFAVWNLSHELVRRAIFRFSDSFVAALTGTGQSATVVRNRTGSLAAIGASPLEIGAKLFLPSLLFCAVVGVLMLGVALGRLDDETSDADAFVEYLCVALAGLLAFDALLLVAGSTSDLFFRTLGAVMAVVTVLAVFAIPRVMSWLPRRPNPTVRQVGAIVAVVVLLVATVPILYPSPYIFQTNGSVSEQQLSGHEIVFEHQAPGTDIVSVRGGPWRSYHGIYGVVANDRRDEWRDNGVPFLQLGSLQSIYDTDQYVTLEDKDRLRETSVYRELRYTDAGFASLDWQRDVHRVTTNGEFYAYLVDKGGETA